MSRREPHVVLGEVVIIWIHHGADNLGRSRRQTPGRTVSLVDELAFTKTLASIALPVSGATIEFGSPPASMAPRQAIFRVEGVG